MTITKKTTFLHEEALMQEPSGSREKKKVLTLFWIIKDISFLCI